jgi:Ase1/PRC1/MAP65 family protein
MDTPPEERKLFDHVTCNISASVDEVTLPDTLALDLIEQVLETFWSLKIWAPKLMLTYYFVLFMKAEVEVERLDQLKASRMKEIAFKKQAELEEIFANAHIEIDSDAAR